MTMNLKMKAILILSALTTFVVAAGGCKDGEENNARRARFWVSPQAAEVIRGINDRLQDKAAGVSLHCNEAVEPKSGKVACLALNHSVIESSLSLEQIYVFGKENETDLPQLIRMSGGSQDFQRALYESLEGATPLLERMTEAVKDFPSVPYTAYKLFLEDKQFEIFCTKGRYPQFPERGAYDCLMLLFAPVLAE